MIDRSPEVMHLAIDLHVDLVEMPTPWGVDPHAIDALFADFGSEHRAEAVPPKPDGFMADIDPAFGEQVFNVAQRQRVFDVKHDHEADHLGRTVEIAERVLHP